MSLSYTLVRSKRRSLSLMITPQAELLVRAPLKAPLYSIESFITRKSLWIQKTKARVAALPKPKSFTPEQIKELKKQARQTIPERVAEISQRFGLTYKSIRITSAARRWGSCSHDNRLNFSWRLMLTTPSVIDYVVAHELAHIRHKNHSRDFWDCVEKMHPNVREDKCWLKENRFL